MKIKVEKINNSYVMKLSGSFSLSDVGEFKKEAQKIVKLKGIKIVDLTYLQYIDSSGLGALIWIKKNIKDFENKLFLVGVNSQILEIFKITKFDKIFNIKKDIDDVLKLLDKNKVFVFTPNVDNYELIKLSLDKEYFKTYKMDNQYLEDTTILETNLPSIFILDEEESTEKANEKFISSYKNTKTLREIPLIYLNYSGKKLISMGSRLKIKEIKKPYDPYELVVDVRILSNVINGTDKKVLFVTTTDNAIKKLISKLSKHNFEVDEISSELNLVDGIVRTKPNIILIDSDLISDYNSIKRARMLYEGIPIIAFGKNQSRDFIVYLVSAGISEYVLKPIDVEAALKKINYFS